MPNISHTALKIPSPSYIHLIEPDHLCEDEHNLLVYRDKLGLVLSLLHWENQKNDREAIVFYYPTSPPSQGGNNWKFEHFESLNEALNQTKIITNSWRDEQSKIFNIAKTEYPTSKEFISDGNDFHSLNGNKIHTREKASLSKQNDELVKNAMKIKLINLTNRFREENFLNDFKSMISHTKLSEHLNI